MSIHRLSPSTSIIEATSPSASVASTYVSLSSSSSPASFHPHLEIVRTGAILVLCDAVVRDANDDAECTTWLLVDHLHDLLDLVSSESIVRDFFHHLFQDATSAHLVLQAMDARFDDRGAASSSASSSSSSSRSLCRRLNALETLSGVPAAADGPLLRLLLTRFLPSHHAALARRAAKIAAARVELALAALATTTTMTTTATEGDALWDKTR